MRRRMFRIMINCTYSLNIIYNYWNTETKENYNGADNHVSSVKKLKKRISMMFLWNRQKKNISIIVGD